MKKLCSFIIISLNIIPVMAQDTLKSADFPNAGATYVNSIGSSFTGMDATATGANYNWDYSQLGRTGQRFDTMFTTAATDPLLSFFFIDISLNSNRANHAAKGLNFNLGATGLSNVFNYYYNSTAEYRQPGFGAVINSVPIPIAYTPHDVLYKFPLKYNDEDSVSYSYVVDLTSTAGIYYHVNRKRHNLVDGWGTLITPYGTFEVLRVQSVILEQDSVNLSGIGFNLPQTTSKEYKWLGKSYGLPLLQINTTGTDVVTQIVYQDSVDLSGIQSIPEIVREPSVFPNPASEKIIINYSLYKNTDVKISFISLEGKQIFSLTNKSQPAGENIKLIDLSDYKLSSGNYFIKLEAGNSAYSLPVQINR